MIIFSCVKQFVLYRKQVRSNTLPPPIFHMLVSLSINCLSERPPSTFKLLRCPTPNYKLQNANPAVNHYENQCIGLPFTGGPSISFTLSAPQFTFIYFVQHSCL